MEVTTETWIALGPLGHAQLTISAAGLTALTLLGPRGKAHPGAPEGVSEALRRLHAQVADLPLAPAGTAFQRRVWEALLAIPAGSTLTYAELARSVGSPGGARAVASACAANPIAFLIPCHRILRSDGGLGGYRWALWRKALLLAAEGAAPSQLALNGLGAAREPRSEPG